MKKHIIVKNKMTGFFKILSVFLLSLVLCSSAGAWTRHKKPLEQEFNKLLKEHSFWKNNYEKQKEGTKTWKSSLEKLRKEKEEALNNNPEFKAKYSNWKKINNLLIGMRRGPQQQYESALREVNKSIKKMIKILSELNNMEVRYQHLLNDKKTMLKSLE